MKVVLERYHGLGNDYVVFDPNKNELKLSRENVKMICDRNAGLGSDGVRDACEGLESGWKRVGDQWNRRSYFCKISEGRKLCPKEEF